MCGGHGMERGHRLRPDAPGQTVLVLGTGGVSLFALQFAKMAGAHVIATSSSDDKLDRVQTLGADVLINYRTTPQWQDEVLRHTNGRGVDLVVEVGGAGTMARSLASTATSGRIAVIGVLAGGGQVDPLTLIPRRSPCRAFAWDRGSCSRPLTSP